MGLYTTVFQLWRCGFQALYVGPYTTVSWCGSQLSVWDLIQWFPGVGLNSRCEYVWWHIALHKDSTHGETAERAGRVMTHHIVYRLNPWWNCWESRVSRPSCWILRMWGVSVHHFLLFSLLIRSVTNIFDLSLVGLTGDKCDSVDSLGTETRPLFHHPGVNVLNICHQSLRCK